MSYTVTVSSNIFSVDNLLSNKCEFRLPLTEFKGVNPIVYPNSISTTIAASSVQTFDFNPMGNSLKLLAAKSTRPVTLFLITEDREIELPRATYFSYMIDSKEPLAELVTSVRVEVPPAALVAPSPAPARYPDVIFEMFALLSKTT